MYASVELSLARLPSHCTIEWPEPVSPGAENMYDEDGFFKANVEFVSESRRHMIHDHSEDIA
jgi:hypothetical protein